MELLIHGVPGSRLNFVAAVINDRLLDNMFDVGLETPVALGYHKIHRSNNNLVAKFPGNRIYIEPAYENLDRHFFLFLVKNMFDLEPAFRTYHYTDRRILDKMYYSYREWMQDKHLTQKNLYNYIIQFEQTFDINFMCDLYRKINQKEPSRQLINAMHSTNQANSPELDQNHVAKVAAEIIKFESANNLTEASRQWQLNQCASFDDDGVCHDPDNLYNNIVSHLTIENYQNQKCTQ